MPQVGPILGVNDKNVICRIYRHAHTSSPNLFFNPRLACTCGKTAGDKDTKKCPGAEVSDWRRTGQPPSILELTA
ncbi:unnamed protein product, partial [Nesidiocoris tenuis]